MFTWNTFLVVRLVGGKVRRIKMEKSKWEFSTYLVWWERGRMEEEVSEVSTWITKSHPPKLERKVCEKMFITENLLFCPFWLQHFLFSTKKEKRKKSYNNSIVINYCNKNIPPNLFKSAFYFFNFPSYLPNTLGDNIFYHSTFLCFIHYLLYLTLPSLIGVHCPSQHAWCDRVHEIVYNEY